MSVHKDKLSSEERMTEARTLYRKIWDAHVVERLPTELACSRRSQLIYERTSRPAFEQLRAAGNPVRAPRATLAMADHSVPTRNRATNFGAPSRLLTVLAVGPG